PQRKRIWSATGTRAAGREDRGRRPARSDDRRLHCRRLRCCAGPGNARSASLHHFETLYAMSANASAIAAFHAAFPSLAKALGPAVELLLDGAALQSFPAGRKLIRDRMPVECIYLVLEGTLSASIEDGGKSRKLAEIGP